MGFWSRLLGREAKGMTSADLSREVWLGGRDSHAGVTVTTDTALEDATAFACMRVISEGGSQVPWHLYREVDGRKSVAGDHPLNDLLYRRPNSWQTSFEFRETLYLHLLAAGNAYVFVNRVKSGTEIAELIILEPHRVSVRQKADYSLEYLVSSDTGARTTYDQTQIWHLRGPSWNSWAGLDAIKFARNALGLSASLEQGQSEFQKNGANITGIVSVDGKLDKARFELLSTWIDRHQLGGDRAHKPLIVDDKGKYTPTAMTGVDQQLIETRKHQVEDICRRFRVMPLMVGHPADMAARAATESIFLQHVVHTLMPWYQRIEQSADVNLLTPNERQAGYYTKFNANALMRGAAKDRAEYYAKALGSGGTKGWLTQNDVRGLEDMDKSDDPAADELPQPTSNPAADAPSDTEDNEDEA